MDVQCHDLSTGGVSFLLPGSPKFEFAVIGLGQSISESSSSFQDGTIAARIPRRSSTWLAASSCNGSGHRPET